MADARTEESGKGWPLRGKGSGWELFAQGRPGDRARPNAWQVIVLNDLSGADGRCAGASDDEVFGVLGQWGAAGSWLEGRKLAVVRELIRRRPDERSPGTATESGLPWDWDARLAREVSLQLGVSVPAAGKLIWAAWALEARLPGIGAALDEGRLDPGRARMVVQETDVLRDPEMLAAAEQMILAGLARCRTWADLVRLVQRAVVTVDPDGARKRREQEEKENARVRFWREAAGTCALTGTGLPTDEALMAHANVEQRAQEYRRAGVRRPIEILRVAAYLDLLNGVSAAVRVARFQAEDQAEDEARAEDETGQAGRDARMRAAAKKTSAGTAGHPPGAGDGEPGDADGDAPEMSASGGGAAGGDHPGDDGTREDGVDDGSVGSYGSAGGPDYPGDFLPDGPMSPCAGCGYHDCRCGDPRDPGQRDGDPRDPGQHDGSASPGGGTGTGAGPVPGSGGSAGSAADSGPW